MSDINYRSDGASKFNIDLASPFLACAAYFRQHSHQPSTPKSKAGAHLRALDAAVSNALASLAKLCEPAFPGWTADSVNPGYLVRQIPPSFFRIPAHLVAVFPDDASLHEVWELANTIKTDASSIIYISGSSAVKRVFEYVDDIDFCEYIPKSGIDLAQAVLSKLLTIDDLMCLRLSMGPQHWQKPFEYSEVERALSNTDPLHSDRSSLKLDYLARRRAQRAYDVSNVILVCDSNFRSESLSRTFAFQEGQVAATDCVPNKLTNALELGRYICWLVDQTKYYRGKSNYVKALKRALSLTRVCWLGTFSDEIKFFFDNSCLMIDQEIETVSRMKTAVLEAGSEWADDMVVLERSLELLTAQRQMFQILEWRHYPEGSALAANQLLLSIQSELKKRSGGAI